MEVKAKEDAERMQQRLEHLVTNWIGSIAYIRSKKMEDLPSFMSNLSQMEGKYMEYLQIVNQEKREGVTKSGEKPFCALKSNV